MISSRKRIIVVIFGTAIFIFIFSAWMYRALFPYSLYIRNSNPSLHSGPRLKKLFRSSWMPYSTKFSSSRKSELTTSVPLTGLANNTLIGRFQKSLSFPINWPHTCSSDNGKNLTLLIVIISDISRRESRRVIRRTWGGYGRRRGAKIIFLAGKSSKIEDQQALVKESTKFKDIIQENLVDAYFNLTLKTVGMMKWVSEHCRNVKFLLKTDDDMFINIDLLFDYIKDNAHLRYTIVGSLWTGGQPIRTEGWWYVPKSVYPYLYYPHYVSGGAYLVTGDSVPLLYSTSLRVPYFVFEDVLMSGMVAEKAGVKRVDNPKFSTETFDIKKCNFMNIITAHDYSPKNMSALWKEFSRKDIKC